MKLRSVERLHALVLIVYVAASVVLSTRLPARIPLHLDFHGRVTAWTTSRLLWFLGTAVAIGMAAMILGLRALARRTPETYNVPDKARYLALPPDKRAPITAHIEVDVARMSLLITLSIMVVHFDVYWVAVTGATQAPWQSKVLLFALLAAIAALLVRSNRAIKQQIRAAYGEAPPVPPP